MILLLIILSVFFLISLFFLFISISTLEIEIVDLYLNTKRKKKNKLETYLFNISLKLFNKIKWINIKIDNKKIEKLKNNKRIYAKLNNKILKFKKKILDNSEQYININSLNTVKILDIKLKRLRMNLKLGLEDAILTSFTTAVLSGLLGIVLAKLIGKFEDEKYIYVVTPYYTNTNFLKIRLNCIINVKMVHIINVIYTSIKKRSEVKYARASNRRTYDYSHE